MTGPITTQGKVPLSYKVINGENLIYYCLSRYVRYDLFPN